MSSADEAEVTMTIKTALVVDDDPEVRRLITRYLEHEHFVVSTASDNRTTLRLLAASRPTLLCLDLMLPEASGFDVCEHILAEPRLTGLPILMISARSMPEDRAMAEELGVRRYLVKPFSHAEFAAAVKDVLQEEPP